jgi:hypothetical protein
MAISVHHILEAYRVNQRFPIVEDEVIPANDNGGIFLMLDSDSGGTNNRLTAGTTGNDIVGVSDNKEELTGDADGTVFSQFLLANRYVFKCPQGTLLDAEVYTGAELYINATSDGLTTAGSGAADARITGHHTEFNGTAMIQFTLLNPLPVTTP